MARKQLVWSGKFDRYCRTPSRNSTCTFGAVALVLTLQTLTMPTISRIAKGKVLPCTYTHTISECLSINEYTYHNHRSIVTLLDASTPQCRLSRISNWVPTRWKAIPPSFFIMHLHKQPDEERTDSAWQSEYGSRVRFYWPLFQRGLAFNYELPTVLDRSREAFTLS